MPCTTQIWLQGKMIQKNTSLKITKGIEMLQYSVLLIEKIHHLHREMEFCCKINNWYKRILTIDNMFNETAVWVVIILESYKVATII